MRNSLTPFPTRLAFFLVLASLAITLHSCSSCSRNNNEKEDSKGILVSGSYDSTCLLNNPYDLQELEVTASPSSERSMNLAAGEEVVDYDVSPAAPIAAILIRKGSEYFIKIWEAGKNYVADSFKLLSGMKGISILWHPQASSLYLTSFQNSKYSIFKYLRDGKEWKSKEIFSSKEEIIHPVFCPRPFIVQGYSTAKEYKQYYSYRLFMGMAKPDKSFRIVSITE